MFGENWTEGISVSLGSLDQMPMDAIWVHLIGIFILSWVIGITAPVPTAVRVLIVATIMITAQVLL